MTRGTEDGVSLLNVLVVVAAATGLVQVMLAGQEGAVTDQSRSYEVAQAEALAHSGVASVAVALRRDMKDAPEADHLREDWAKAAQSAVSLEFGRFQVDVVDARGRFNLNSLQSGAFLEQRVFGRLLNALDLPEALLPQIVAMIQDQGALDDARQLIDLGLADADVKMMLPHVAALAWSAPINLNTATEPVMAALFANPTAARSLAARRDARGYLAADDLRALGVVMPPFAGFTSDTFDVSARATVGMAERQVKRRITRDAEQGSLTIQTLP